MAREYMADITRHINLAKSALEAGDRKQAKQLLAKVIDKIATLAVPRWPDRWTR